jgi:predicted nucleic acid-binding protein
VVAAFVLDASVAAAWCFADEATDASRALHDSLAERSVIVPLIWHAECTNLLLVAERRRRISAAQCNELLELLEMLPVQTEPETDRLHGPIARLARSHGLTVYDAIYLDLAMRFGVSLATRNGELQRAAKAEGLELIDV